MADLAAIRAAAAKVRAITWTHGDDCPHRYCDEPDDCADGDGAAIVGDGVHCDCYVSDIARLLAAIDAAETNAADPLASICAAHARTSAFLAGEKPEAGKEGASEMRTREDSISFNRAHVRLTNEMGTQDDAANARSLGVMLSADGCPERCAELYATSPPDGDPWIARAVALLAEERARVA